MNEVAARYEALLTAGELCPDEDQARAVAVLDRLAREFDSTAKRGLWSRLTGAKPAKTRGIYMWGAWAAANPC
jgi:cell division protein ZapE